MIVKGAGLSTLKAPVTAHGDQRHRRDINQHCPIRPLISKPPDSIYKAFKGLIHTTRPSCRSEMNMMSSPSVTLQHPAWLAVVTLAAVPLPLCPAQHSVAPPQWQQFDCS